MMTRSLFSAFVLSFMMSLGQNIYMSWSDASRNSATLVHALCLVLQLSPMVEFG